MLRRTKRMLLLATVLLCTVASAGCKSISADNEPSLEVLAETQSKTDESNFGAEHETAGNESFTESEEMQDTSVLRVYLVRHGQTYSNIKGLLVGGGANAPLTDEGVAGAKAVGLGLKSQGIDFNAVYSSTLGRTRETAALIAPGQEITAIEDLKDIGWAWQKAAIMAG